MVISSINGVLTIFLILLVGLTLTRKGLLTHTHYEFCNKLIITIAIPCTMFDSATRNVTPDSVAQLGALMLVPVAVQLTGFVVALLFARLFKIPERKRGVFVTMFSQSNTILIGLPMCLAIFGELSIPYVTAFYLSNTLCFWLLAVPMIARDGSGETPSFGRRILRAFSPPVIGFLAGSVFGLTGIALPSFFTNAVTYLGGMTTPMSVLVVGHLFAVMGKNAWIAGREVKLAMVGKCLVLPAICIAYCKLFRVPTLPTGVFIAESGMPVMNQAVIMSGYYKADDRAAAQGLVLSLLLLIGTVPAFIAIYNLLFT